MPQDIQTFYEALDIKPKLDVTVTVAYRGFVIGSVEFNGQRCVEGINHFQADLMDPLVLTSDIKQYVEGSSAIEIIDFTVNGYNVIPLYQHHSSSGNAYHDWIGQWHIDITDPFYVWYHCASGQGWIA